MTHAKTNIMKAMRQIQQGDLVLPGIQRDFVWQPARIYALLDSILRDYPFGTLLFWNTRQPVQYRAFATDWTDGFRPTFVNNSEGKRATLVLDGQQRLQSLYLALMGTHEHRQLYFDLLSGRDDVDVSEMKYIYEFLSADDAQRRNEQQPSKALWVPLREIAMIPDRNQLVPRTQAYQAAAQIDASSEEGRRLAGNVSDVFYKLNYDDLLSFFTIDPEFGDNGQVTTLDQVLEIFVRTNSGGEVLTKSDLMFSLMQLQWQGAADAIADLCETLNGKGRFFFDKDFVLKCALVCTGQGARYSVEKLRRDGVLEAIRDSFGTLADSLCATVDFIVNTGRLRDGRVLGSYNTLIPLVYYVYLNGGRLPKQESERLAMNQALYLALMTHALSRYADNRIDRVVRQVLDPARVSQPGVFPLSHWRAFCREVEGIGKFDDDLLQRNIPLLMNILEGGSMLPEGRRRHRPEYDHVFPQSKLRQYGYPEELVNDYANFRLVSKRENIFKLDADPEPYFTANPELRPRYLVPEGPLTYDRYEVCLQARRAMIWERVHTFLGIVEDEEEIKPEPPPAVEMTEPESHESIAQAHTLSPSAEAVCRVADENGIGEPFRRLVDGILSLGLRLRPYKYTMGFLPDWGGRSLIFNTSAFPSNEGQLKGWCWPDRMSEFMGMNQDHICDALWSGGAYAFDADQVEWFLDTLDKLMQERDTA